MSLNWSIAGVDSRLETVDLEYSDAEGPLNKTLESDSEHLRKLPSAKPKEVKIFGGSIWVFNGGI
mgnify:CR=1 FL=1